MFKKILFPTDFSESSEKVLPYLKHLKEAGTEEIVILHVLDERYRDWKDSLMWMTEDARNELVNDVAKSATEIAEKELDNLEKELKPMFKVKIVLEGGKPFKTILDVADRENVSCITMASKGATDLQEILLGSVTERVVRKSSQPCLII